MYHSETSEIFSDVQCINFFTNKIGTHSERERERERERKRDCVNSVKTSMMNSKHPLPVESFDSLFHIQCMLKYNFLCTLDKFYTQ